MNDLISRCALFNKLATVQTLGEAYGVIQGMETVDAVPVVHGKWEWISSTYDRIPCEKRYQCSKCHHETITHESDPWEKFCPNCGAKMDGKDGEQHDTDIR